MYFYRETNVLADETHTPSGGRRKRKASVSGDFDYIALETCGAARRDAGPSRPPPTLPRMYVELEPRVVSSHDHQLTDYLGEPIGLLADFNVSWRLRVSSHSSLRWKTRSKRRRHLFCPNYCRTGCW